MDPEHYDVFLSYAHADKSFAKRLEKALTAYSAPWFSGLTPQRLRVFRDDSEAAGTDLSVELAKALEISRKLIILCSPTAHNRPWVNQEIRYFAKRKGNKDIVPLLIAGRPNSEAKAQGAGEEAAFPPALIETLGTEPWAPDFRLINHSGQRVTAERTAWYHLLASLYEVSRETIEQRERSRKIWRMLRNTTGVVLAAVFLLITWGWQERLSVKYTLLKLATTFMRVHLEPEVVEVKASSFRMGDIQGLGVEAEQPVHVVQIQKPFNLGRHEVTFDEYDRFALATGRRLPNDWGWGRGQQPVIDVSWEDAVGYAEWLSKQTRKSYRLPTEAEWEYAARSGGSGETWAGTSREEELGDFAWHYANSQQRAQTVGATKKPNGLGLYGLSGNVEEWVEDCMHNDYRGAPTNGSAWKEEGGGYCGVRVLRGGSWNGDPHHLRSSHRSGSFPDTRTSTIGFRLVQDPS